MEDVHQLRVFTAVAENLSFTRAAEVMFMTQSGVSHQIARLEQALGAQLFTREARSVALTRAGETLLRHARKLFASLEDAVAAVRQASDPDSGTLRIGASITACQYVVPEALREFRESFPAYSLRIMPGDGPVVMQGLADGSLDLGIVVRHQRKDKLTYHPLFTDTLGFIVSPLHKWARAGRADRRELSQQRMILYNRQSTTFRLVEQYFVRARAELRDWIELGSMEAIKELVKLGLGVSVAGRWTTHAEVTGGSLVWLPIPGATLKRNWFIAHSAGRTLSLAEQTFIGLCQSAGSVITREAR
jgi:LysR family transcriptional regulator, low CO2-responsive transcriptional regulator